MLDWTQLEAACQTCNRCGLCQTRTNVVFGVGPKDADILLVGEGPGQQEDLAGEPFVGPAGHLLDDMLSIIDLGRELYVYLLTLLSAVRQKTGSPGIGTGRLHRLFAQPIPINRPKIIICLGRIAAMRLIRQDYRITREHGQWVEKQGIWMTAIYHPSALLRDLSKRPETFRDLLSIREKIRETGITPPSLPN